MSKPIPESDPKTDQDDKPPAPVPTLERPDVKPLVEKAGAGPGPRIPHGVIRTGADIAGGGGTKSLEPKESKTDQDQPSEPETTPKSE